MNRFLCLLIAAIPLFAQETEQKPVERNLPAYKEGLVPVPLPDLNKAEDVVAAQIGRYQRTLALLIRNHSDKDAQISDAYGLLGTIYHAYGIRMAARACYENAHTLNPEKFNWPYFMGIITNDMADIEIAMDYFSRAAQIKVDYAPLWVRLGDLAMSFGEHDKAKEHYEKALALNPQSGAAFYGLGQANYQKEEYTNAILFYEKALAIVPQANRIHYSMGLTYRKMKNMEKARFHIERAGKVGVKEADPLFNEISRNLRGERVYMQRGQAAYNAGRPDQAADEYRKALKSKPDSQRARLNLATALAAMQKYDEAISEFEALLKLDPTNMTSHFNIGSLLAAKGDFERAESHLKTVIEKEPRDVNAKLKLAEIYTKSGKFAEAKDIFTKVQTDQGLDANGAISLAAIYKKEGQHKQALALLEDSYTRMPGNGLIMNELAYILAASPDGSIRDGARAFKLAQQVVQASPIIPHIQTMAMAYAELGDCAAAAQMLKQVLETVKQAGNEAIAAQILNQVRYFETNNPCRPPLAQAAE